MGSSLYKWMVLYDLVCLESAYHITETEYSDLYSCELVPGGMV